MRIAPRNELLRGHDDHRKSALKLRNRNAHGILDRVCLQARLRDDIRDNFSIACGMEDRAALFERAAEHGCIAEIAVMHKRHFALLVIDLHRLTVSALIAARCAVARMTDRSGAVRKTAEHLRRKYMLHKPQILMRREHAVIIERNAAALLPAVLQGK